MLNTLRLLLLIAPAISFGAIVRHDYFFNKPEIAGDAVFMEGCHPFYSPFVPNIPVRSVRLLLPDGERALAYDVTYDAPITLPVHGMIRPYRPEVRIGARPGQDYFTRTADLFRINRFFPPDVKQTAFTTQYKNGHPIFFGQIHPVQYNPVTGALHYFRRISVTVRTSPAGPRERPTAVLSTPLVKDALSRLVDNPGAIAKIAGTASTPGDYEYLIVTTASLQNGFGDFVAFNTRRGFRTKIATLETIRSLFANGYADDQERIRAFIRQEYANCAIEYVLLAGDAEAASPNRIPDRKLFSEAWDYNFTGKEEDHFVDSIPADLYYGCLDLAPHDWKPVSGGTRWGYYGSEDVAFEVLVGRFPVDDAAELATMIRKTIRYSEHPVESLCTRALLAGEFMWGPPDQAEMCYGDDEMDQLIGSCSVTYGPLAGFPPDKWRITKLYDRPRVWEFGDFVDSMNGNKSAFINHEGHSDAYYLFKTSGSDMTEATFPQACTPSTGNYLVVLSGGCTPGAFDNNNSGDIMSDDCIAERITAELPTGAVCALMNARSGFGSDGSNNVAPTDGSEQRIRRYFHHGLFGIGYHTVGQLDAYSKEVNAALWTNPAVTRYDSYFGQMRWETYEKNIIGDPALSIWTDTPHTLVPSLPLSLANTSFSVQVPRYSVVALAVTGKDSIITSVSSDTATTVTLRNSVLTGYLLAHRQGQLDILIKAHNYYPFRATIPVNVAVVPGGGNSLPVFSAAAGRKAIRYFLPAPERVGLKLFNARGIEIFERATEEQAGPHLISLENRNLAPGIYFCRLTAGTQKFTEKMVIVR